MTKLEKDLVVEHCDGGIERIPGKEPLKKDPKKKTAKERWAELQKAIELNNESAILDLHKELAAPRANGEDPSSQGDEEDQEQQEELEELINAGVQVPDEEGAEESQVVDSEEELGDDDGSDISGDEMPSEEFSEEDQIDMADGQDSMQEQLAEQQQEESPEIDHSKEEQQIIDAMREHGYSDAEIAYVIHGYHAPAHDELQQLKADSARAQSDMEQEFARQHQDHDLQHKKRMSDIEHEAAKASMMDPQLDRDHKKRMLDLEFEITKQQKEMELEFRRKELELKLKSMEEAAKKRLEAKSAQKQQGDSDE